MGLFEMTMHLLGPQFTTTSTRKRKSKNKTKSLLTAEAEHEKYLRKMGVHPEQREQKARSSVRLERTAHNGYVGGSNPSGPTNKSVKCYGSISDSKPEGRGSTPRTDANIPTYNASMAKRKEKVYTGTEIVGIATMHKSNMVPVRGKKQAIEIAKMRRG
jgi:hypothetical protein